MLLTENFQTEKTLVSDDLEQRCTDCCATPSKLFVSKIPPQLKENQVAQGTKKITKVCPALPFKQKLFFNDIVPSSVA